MFDILVTGEQVEFANSLVQDNNFGMRGKGDGNKKEQFVGMLGQTVVGDSLHYPRPTGGEGFDGGYDFNINGKRVDVKTMGRTTPVRNYYVHNFVGYQEGYDVDYYIFTSFNKETEVLTICGYIDKDNFFKKAKYYEEGTMRYRSDGTGFRTKAPLYEINQSDLYEINEIEEIYEKIR